MNQQISKLENQKAGTKCASLLFAFKPSRKSKLRKERTILLPSCLFVFSIGLQGLTTIAALADNDLPVTPLNAAQQRGRLDYHRRHDAVSTIHLKSVPSDLPAHTMPGAEFTTGETMRRGDGQKSTMLNFSSNQEATSVVDWYDKSLRNDGFKVKVSFTKSGKPDFVICYKDKTTVNIHFMDSTIKHGKSPNPPKCFFTLTVNQPK